MSHYLERVIHPRAVAVIGASNNPLKRGNRAIRTMASANYQGKIAPINPSSSEILGYPSYPSLADVPYEIDLVLVCTAAATVPGILEQCSAKGVKGAIILAGGFSEASEAGAVLEREVVDVARRHGIRLIGPNTSGMFSARTGCNASGWFDVPTGPIAMLSNSANVLLSLVTEFQFQEHSGISVMLSVGNQSDIQFHEYLECVGDDPGTRAVLMYVEGFKDGPAFMASARRVTPSKPIVMYAAGRTEAGKGAAKSHSGSLAGDYAVTQGVLRQSGVVLVEQADHLHSVASALAAFPPMRGRRVAVVSEGGGPITMAAEAIAAQGLVLAPLSAETQARIHAIVPAATAISNPVDAGGGTDPRVEYYGSISQAILEDPGIDALLFVGYFGGYTTRYDESVGRTEREICLQLGELMRVTGKPIMVQTHYAHFKTESLKVLSQAGVPYQRHIEVAVRCLSAAAEYGESRRRLAAPGASSQGGPEAAALAAIATARAHSRDLLETESRAILAAYGVAMPPSMLLRDAGAADDADVAARAFGDARLALKIVSKDILHKSDAGGVKLNVVGAEGLREARAEIMSNVLAFDAQAAIEGVLATPMAPRGTEIIIGVVRDPQYGPVIMFGLGGIFVEVLRDVTFRALPLAECDARAMVDDLRHRAVLAGARGAAAVDRERLTDLLMRVAHIATLHPDIVEIDLNPVIFHEGGYSVVDARMILAPAVAPHD